jgi:calcineurin-like phosphoesterase family protein
MKLSCLLLGYLIKNYIMSQIYFGSDFHYNHANLVRGLTTWDNVDVCRPFDTLGEHNHALVKSINDTVKEHDRLYFLGDWSMGGRDEVFNFRRQLHCKNIHVILGNHDIHIAKNYNNCKNLFNSVELYSEIKIGNTHFVLFHYPINSWHKKKSTEHSSVHLYGHVHTELNMHPSSKSVCIDAHPEFRPYHIDEIREIIKNNYK